MLPPFYILAPLGVLGLPGLRLFSRPVVLVLAIYALSQQIPALFTPEPLLASVLALLRTVLLFGLIGLGALLSDSRHLRFLIPGLIVVYLTAIGFALWTHTDLTVVRLNHPYITSVSLGLSGAFGIWLTLFLSGQLWWRMPLGIISLAILMLSGSRGPLLAAIIGCIFGAAIRASRKTIFAVILGVGMLVGGFVLGSRLNIAPIARLESGDGSGRDIIWSNTISIIQAFPLTGVGSYRLGNYLTPPNRPCEFFGGANGLPQECPEWLSSIGSPWLIAHNLTFQQMAETGAFGFIGFLNLLGVIIYATIKNKDPLSVSIIFGILFSNITDNTITIPNVFFSEIFWIIAGMQLLEIHRSKKSTVLYSIIFGFLTSFPLLSQKINQSAKNYSFRTLIASEEIKSAKNYEIFAQMNAPAGLYRIDVQICTISCISVKQTSFQSINGLSPPILINVDLWPKSTQIVKFRLLNGESGYQISALASKEWKVSLVK